MENKLKNPIAFPRTAFNQKGDITTFDPEFEGMTLKDYFANSAMQGILSNRILSDYLRGDNGLPDPTAIADISYKIAKEMLKQSENENN